MAHKIIWSLQAREDLREIVTYIRQDNSDAATAFGYALIKLVDVLENFPKLSRRAPEFDDENIREVIHRPYRITYQSMEARQLVAMVRDWHGARGQPKLPGNCSFDLEQISMWP